MADLAGLSAVLNEELRLLEEMIAAEEKTMPMLVEGDTLALQEITAYKEKLVREMKELEEKRRLLHPPGFTLQELCLREGFPGGDCLQDNLPRRLCQLHASLQRRIALNRRLLKHHLQFVGYALELFFPQKEEPLYASSGKVADKAPFPAGLLDSNA